jgi:hypothetical protein
MTPKEEAKELVDKFYMPLPLKREVITKVKKIPFEYNDWGVAKQCALIAVDKIMETDPMIEWGESDAGIEYKSNYDYWQEVKQEIEKL